MKSSRNTIKILNCTQNSILLRMPILRSTHSKVVHLLNTYNLALANSNHNYFCLLQQSEYNLIDGKFLQISLKNFYRTQVYQLRGIDLMKSILSTSSNGVNHLFVCPEIENASRLKMIITENYPNLQCEFVVPPISNDIEVLGEAIKKLTNRQNFDYIWVGVGTPKQDFLAQILSNYFDGAYIVCIGAALDFLAGTKREAPIFMQRMGLEWFFRFGQEPRRLFKRYFIDSWGFLSLIIRRKIEIEEI